ncbi:MAG: hypothetical protein ACE5FO_12780 [Parvularculaceae bacterium]
MARRLKLLTGLSTLALSGALALSACGGEGEAEGAEGEGARVLAASSEGEGAEGEGGEGEGESEGAASADPVTDDVEYLKRLGLVRGHLVAFIELTRAGAPDAAATHAKHPQSELYADLIPAFEARGKKGFADALDALNDAAASGADVEAAYAAAKDAIRATAPKTSNRNELLAIAGLVRTAAEEFAIGVGEDGEISNAHEYQDAYGFVTVAGQFLDSLSTEDKAEADAIAFAKEQVEGLSAAFPGWRAERTDGETSLLFGAAARIEIAALGLS